MDGSTVIVGAGSAGGALAARLSEDPSHEVILIEAGPSYLDLSDEELPDDIRDAGEMSVDAHGGFKSAQRDAPWDTPLRG